MYEHNTKLRIIKFYSDFKIAVQKAILNVFQYTKLLVVFIVLRKISKISLKKFLQNSVLLKRYSNNNSKIDN